MSRPRPPARADEAGGLHRDAAVVLAVHGSGDERLSVLENAEFRWLEFADGAVQSAMDRGATARLVLPYCAWMLGGLALLERLPARLALLGLGGAALARYWHRSEPACALHAVEVDARVVTAAQRWFHCPVPADNLVIDDARNWLHGRPAPMDALLCDLFGAQGMPEWVAHAEFFDACRAALSRDGWLAVNLAARDQHHLDAILDAARAGFDGQVLCLAVPDTANHIALAFATPPRRRPRVALLARAQNLGAALGLPLRQMTSALLASHGDVHAQRRP